MMQAKHTVNHPSATAGPQATLWTDCSRPYKEASVSEELLIRMQCDSYICVVEVFMSSSRTPQHRERLVAKKLDL